MSASVNGDAEKVKAYLDKGINVNVKNDEGKSYTLKFFLVIIQNQIIYGGLEPVLIKKNSL